MRQLTPQEEAQRHMLELRFSNREFPKIDVRDIGLAAYDENVDASVEGEDEVV